jgi:hypothetical protein
MRVLWQSLVALLIATCATGAAATPPSVIIAAEYTEPTRRYAHGILGDDVEWGALKITVEMCMGCEIRDVRSFLIRLPEHRVFEDTEPRVVDLDGRGFPSVVVVESDADQGARLAIYTQAGFQTGTPFIGRRNRWLAPIGAIDLDGDGTVELAYIDRPHLAKTLRVWRYSSGTLEQIASQTGLTNHRIGDRDIAGGIRNCVGAPEMVVATADWSRLMAVTFQDGTLTSKDIGPHQNRSSFSRAMRCP